MTPEREPRAGAFRTALETRSRQITAVELVTGRGVIGDPDSRATLALARELADRPHVDVLSLTDNPAGTAWLAPDAVAQAMQEAGQEVIVHLACKDWNRNALQSRLWKLSSDGLDNILALSGDFPLEGYAGGATPVFDLDSVGLLRMTSDMNAGLHDAKLGRRQPTSFFAGAVVTNHESQEREVVPQYLKLRKKVENGAAFVINQIGYHARKDDELLRWMRMHEVDVPVLANVFALTRGVARVFHEGRVPGVVVTDELLELAERHGGSPDKGKGFFHELAAKQVAIGRGLGFAGVYLGGHLAAAEIDAILERADAISDSWRDFAREIQYPYPDEFHFFEQDRDTGLSSDVVDRTYVESRARARRRHAGTAYRTNRAIHGLAFEPGGRLHSTVRRIYARVDGGAAPVRRALHTAEHATKVVMFRCKDCGDCSLPDIAYLCPESQCVKNQRNGPCGGTRQGICEIGTKECIWARAYDRLKAYGEEEEMLDGPAVVKNGSLRATSAWANTLLGRDHHAVRREETTT